MIELGSLCSAAVLVGGVAVLALSLAAKLADWDATSIMWPVTGALRRIAGPVQVTVFEGLVVVAVLMPLPVTARLALTSVVFTTYALAALLWRGQRCACFGSWIPTRFTMRHAAGCAVMAVLACIGILGSRRAWAAAEAATAEAATGLVLAAVVAAWLWHRAAADRMRVPADIHHIVIFTAESCGFCTALEAQRGRYEAMADCPVEFRHAESEQDAKTAGNVFPAAVAYGTDGIPVARPAHGLAGIRDLLRQSTSNSRRSETRVTT
jgi:hypothetical protein